MQGTDWEIYKECLIENAEKVGYEQFMSERLHRKIEMMNEWIYDANDKCMNKNIGPNQREVKWATTSIGFMRRRVRKMRRKYQKEKKKKKGEQTDQLWNEYLGMRKEYVNEMRDEKERDWKEFVKENAKEPWDAVYKICRGKRRKNEMTELRMDGVWKTGWNECMSGLLNAFFPDARERVEDEPVECVVEKFQKDEVQKAIAKMKMGKAPGLDGIMNAMISRVWQAIPEFVIGMYESCMSDGVFPRPWKRADVVALLKSPDKIRSDPGSYRPISLLGGFGKILERMMVERLLKQME